MDASPTHRPRLWTLLLVLAACLVTGGACARAAELPASERGAVYVDPAGDDDAAGTAERPLRTVSAGLERCLRRLGQCAACPERPGRQPRRAQFD